MGDLENIAMPNAKRMFVVKLLKYETSWATADPKTFGMEIISGHEMGK